MRITSHNLTFSSNYDKNSSNKTTTEITAAETIINVKSYESQKLELSAKGAIATDNKKIDISLNTSLDSRDIFEYTIVKPNKVDPLVVNFGKEMASVDFGNSFEFDLNADGTKDKIATLANKNAFLAYDKNLDGTINDGTELFGTQGADGFADLAQYDENKDGVIDEADSTFSKLSVWEKSASISKLSSLKEKNIGAIFLKNVNSEFDLSKNGDLNATIRKSGITLFEDGNAGWISHVDFVLQDEQDESAKQTQSNNALNGFLSHQNSSSKNENSVKATIEKLKARLKTIEGKMNTSSEEEQKLLNVEKQSIMQQIAALEELNSLNVSA